MPRAMFGSGIDPSSRMASGKWYTVPLSIVVHTAIVATLIVVPLMALDALPSSPALMVFVGTAATPPSPPPAPLPVPISKVTVASAVSPGAAPLQSPDTIGKENRPESIVRPVVPGTKGVDSTSLDLLVGTSTRVAAAPPPPSPPTPIPAPEPVHVGGNIQAPTRLKSANPVYPAIAQAARVQGFVIVEATIGVDGKVTDARILRSIPLLDAAALEAVRKWEYTPTLLNGQPIAVIMTVTVSFSLR